MHLDRCRAFVRDTILILCWCVPSFVVTIDDDAKKQHQDQCTLSEKSSKGFIWTTTLARASHCNGNKISLDILFAYIRCTHGSEINCNFVTTT